MTSGFSGSPAEIASRSTTGQRLRSSWISMRQTVGGAQKVFTPRATSTSRIFGPLKRV